MRIGATDTKGIDADSLGTALGKGGGLEGDDQLLFRERNCIVQVVSMRHSKEDWWVVVRTLRVGILKLNVRWDGAVFQRENGLDQACEPGGALRVTHVGLYRADVHAVVAKDVANCSCFCWVTYWGTGPVAL